MQSQTCAGNHLHLCIWQEVVGKCVDVSHQETEIIITLDTEHKQLTIPIPNLDCNKIITQKIMTKNLAILRTENTFLIREIQEENLIQKHLVFEALK